MGKHTDKVKAGRAKPIDGVKHAFLLKQKMTPDERLALAKKYNAMHKAMDGYMQPMGERDPHKGDELLQSALYSEYMSKGQGQAEETNFKLVACPENPEDMGWCALVKGKNMGPACPACMGKGKKTEPFRDGGRTGGPLPELPPLLKV